MFQSDAEGLIKDWWIVAARGVAALVFGAFVLGLSRYMSFRYTQAPAEVALTVLFGMYLLIGGGLSIAHAMITLGPGHWRLSIAHGCVLIVAAAWFMVSSHAVLAQIVAIAVAHAAISGSAELVAASALRRHAVERNLCVAAGLLSLSAAVALLWLRHAPRPLADALAAYWLVFGSMLALVALRLRLIRRRMHLLQMAHSASA
jgi:uncharacterized membrane protein HdeD (DUF308 family)